MLLLDNEIMFHEAIIEERDVGIRETQQRISDVNEIFKHLAVLVHDQGAMIGEIICNLRWLHMEDCRIDILVLTKS